MNVSCSWIAQLWISYNYYTCTAVFQNVIFSITEGSTVHQCDNYSYTEYSRLLCTAHFITVQFFALIYRIVVSAPNGTAPGGVIPNTGLIFTCPLQPGECEGLTGNRQGNDNRLFDTQSKVKCVKVKHHIQNFCRYLSIASFPGLPVYTLIPLAFTCRSSPPMYYCEWKVKIGKGWEWSYETTIIAVLHEHGV